LAYDEEMLEWFERRSIINMLHFYRSNLGKMPSVKIYEFIRLGVITRIGRTNRFELTEKGLRLLDESDEFP